MAEQKGGKLEGSPGDHGLWSQCGTGQGPNGVQTRLSLQRCCSSAGTTGTTVVVAIRDFWSRLITIEPGTEMGRQIAIVLYVVAMAAVIVGVDFLFFRNRFWERLTVNIGIVLVFVAFYFRFLSRP